MTFPAANYITNASRTEGQVKTALEDWLAETKLLTPTGVMMAYLSATAPTGWLNADGRTIGNASSGGTSRANADTESLFSLLWTNFANAQLPIQDSAGSADSRGASAAADYAANKRMPLPDLRGRTVVGKDDLGGSAANRVTSGGSGIAGTTMGASGGTQTHTLVTGEIPAHTHTFSTANVTTGSDTVNASAASSGVTNNTPATSSTGGGGAHQNMPPSFIGGWIIKL